MLISSADRSNVPTEIVIDLDDRLENDPRKPNEAIQREAIAHFASLLGSAVDAANKVMISRHSLRNETLDYAGNADRPENVIVLNGGRGSGKTTLLYSLLSAIENPEGSLLRAIGEKKLDEIKVLGVIDPSLIETKENIFVTVLTLLKKTVEKAQEGKKTSDLAEWKQSLQRLAGGLSSLDAIGKDRPHDDWNDALYIMEQGLEKTRSSVGFKRDFTAFLTISLKILNKSLFVIAFDDIDTASHKGWEVLEIIRKYLAASNILVVLSGDLGLYSTIVRQQQWKNFGEGLWSRERSRRDTYRQQINDLEDQYLLKVLSLKNRIDLLRLGQIIDNRSAVDVKVKAESIGLYKPLVDKPTTDGATEGFLDEHIKNYFCVSKRDTNLYRDFILRQPVRSIIQILKALKNSSGAASEGRKAFTDLALGALARHEIRFDALALADDQEILILLREMLNRSNLWDAGYRLRPDLRSDDDNLVTLAFSSRLTAAVNQKPDLMFDYFVKVCLPHEASRYVPTISSGSSESKVTMSQYLEFVSRNLREDSLTEARQNVAVTVKHKGRGTFSISGGVIAVFGARSPLTDTVKPLLQNGSSTDALSVFWGATGGNNSNPVSGVTHNTWNQLLQRLTPNSESPATGLMKHLARLLASQVVSSGTTSTYLSIMNLFGALSHLMKLRTPRFRTVSAVGPTPPLLQQEIRRIAGIRTHPVPSWDNKMPESAVFDEGSNNSTEDDEEEEYTSAQHLLLVAFAKWKRDFTRNTGLNPISIHFLARIWSRFYYTIVSMDTEIDEENKYLGWIIHRYLIAFLSAVLIEEMIELGTEKKGFVLSNPVTSDKIFLTNLGKALGLITTSSASKQYDEKNQLYEQFPFFTSLFACPLWAAFLHPRVELPGKYGQERKVRDIQIGLWSEWISQDELQEIGEVKKLLRVGYNLSSFNTKLNHTTTFDNLFDPLNSVLVQGRRLRDTNKNKTVGEKSDG